MFLKTKQHRQHILGVIIITIALFLVGLSSLIREKKDSIRETNIFGIVLKLLSLLFNGVQFVVEEALLSKYATHPLKIVGYEGLWGLCVYVIILIIMQQIRCDDFSQQIKEDLCSPNDMGEYRLEDTVFALKQLGSNGFLCFLVIGLSLTIAFYNFTGVSITK